jgi:hypothetical protein
MFEVRTTDEFAAWFAALEDDPAEDIATALTTIEKLGPLNAAPGSSEWLLWYDHPEAPQFVVSDDWTSFHDAAKEVVSHIEAPAFAQKLSALPREQAGQLFLAIERLRTATAVGRRGLAMMVASAAARAGRAVDPYATLRRAYQVVGAASGLAMSDLPLNSSALRELTVPLSPADLRGADFSRYRILYGVDLRREVALVVLGERLDRNFYGDTVRRAERVWQQFLQSNAEARDPAPPR